MREPLSEPDSTPELIGDTPWLRHWVVPLYLLAALAFLPWTAWLTLTLPARHVSEHWDAAWTGLDVAEGLALAAVALGAYRRASWLQAAAGSAGTLLVADAWFDILLSSPGRKFWIAMAEAAFAELPLALLCFWIARDVARFWGRWQQMVELVPERARGPFLHLTPPAERPPERDLVGVLEVTADGETAREAGDADPAA